MSLAERNLVDWRLSTTLSTMASPQRTTLLARFFKQQRKFDYQMIIADIQNRIKEKP